MRYRIIINPVAGRGKARRELETVRRVLADKGIQYDMIFTTKAGEAQHLARQAVEEGWEAVVAAGGDGTVGEVINGLAGTRAALGIIPLGTGNDMAHSLGIPLEPRKAAALLENHTVIPVDVGTDPDGYFGIILGLGFPTLVMDYVNTHAGFLRGSLAILGGILSVVAHLEAFPMAVETEKGRLEGKFNSVFILNTPYTGGGLYMSPGARYDDGLFDLVLIGEMGKLDFLTTLPRAYRGTHLSHPRVALLQSPWVKIETEKPLGKMFDGNVFGRSPVEARILPGGLRCLVPSRGNSSAS
ncbi:MAG: diacylglycerol kinase family lipid kinase [Firmicutes bacterium]|nr:diacylglycerol kinase family lipid kinase [Bacillota bacterium]MCL5038508.1 diacylglycerol kinase family lipid kinase [Bacillota bacterium]